MKRNYFLIALALSISLFIYLFYRTEKTVVTELFIRLISLKTYAGLKAVVTSTLPLQEQVIYSLPEGLWVFCITLTSKNLFLRFGKLEINCVFIPLIFSIGLEIFQLVQLANGRFDFWDMSMILAFWLLANAWLNNQPAKQYLLPINLKSSICFLSYAIVYLAHVWK